MQKILLVFLGGGAGSLARYGVAEALSESSKNFPYATLCANIAACIVLGFVGTLAVKDSVTDATRLLLVTGFCGGFSTFSTFSNETFLLLQQGKLAAALFYATSSLIFCLIGVWLGNLISSRV
ncbi:MAG: fluoride efflux transporter CrcB [Bacteroidota bacterium]|jgi:CrcB protein